MIESIASHIWRAVVTSLAPLMINLGFFGMENASDKFSHREDIKKKFTLHVYIQINLFS